MFDMLMRDLETLAKTDAVQASIERCVLCSATGQTKEFERWVRNLENLRQFDEARMMRFQHLINHGYATDALAMADDVFANPANRTIMRIAMGTVAVGGLQKAVAAIDQATKNQYVLKHTDNLPNLRRWAQSATELDIQDAHLAKMIDVVGEILRRNQLYWLDITPQIMSVQSPDERPYISYDYRIGVSPDQAAALTWELTEEFVDRELERQGLYMGFQGVLVPVLEPA